MTAESTRGERWLDQVTTDYKLTPDSAALVHEVARMIDRAGALQAEVDAIPSIVVTTGHGPKVHPAVTEYRATFAALQRALATLGLEA